MCITFFHINSRSRADAFRFILIFNRDEFFSRKTENAHFWEDVPEILGGRDLESKSKGTWLAANTCGKIGALLNIHDQPVNSDFESRGILISDYLKQNIDPSKYVQEVQKNGKKYNGYNLILFDLISSNSTLLHTCLNYGKTQETKILSDGIYGVSNSPSDQPFRKVDCGKQKFESVIEKFNHIEQQERLVEELLLILKSEVKNFPDPALYEMKKHSMDKTNIERLSSIFVSLPEFDYGTRTHTIILITSDNVGYFYEFSLNLSLNNENSQWIRNQFRIIFSS